MKTLLITISAIALSGCVTSYPKQIAGDSYLIDTEHGMMCHLSRCYYLDLIGPSYNEQRVAVAYGLPAKVYTWDTSQFTTLMLNPPQSLYQVTQLSETEYKLPINHATYTAYDVLKVEYDQLFKSGHRNSF